MKIFLFNDTRSQNNWGCRATTDALIELTQGCQAEIVGSLLLEEISTIKTNYLMTVVKKHLKSFKKTYFLLRTLAWKAKKMGGSKFGYLSSISDFESFSDRIFSGEIWSKHLPALLECDLVLVNGEGSIYGEEQKGFHTLFICWFAKVKLKKKCALVNHTCDFSYPPMRQLGEEIYPILDDVIFREPICHEEYRAFLKNDKNSFFPDAAFIFDPVHREELSNIPESMVDWSKYPFDPAQDDYVCILGSSILGRPENGELFPIKQYSALTAKLISKGFYPIFIASDTTDEAPFRQLAAQWNVPFFDASTPRHHGMALLCNASCLIGGRWHPSILGSKGGTPSIMTTANTTKTLGFLKMFSLSEMIFDPFELDRCSDQIIEILQVYISQGETLRSAIRQRAKTYALLAEQNVRACVE
ncbi:MAG: polysaccharide pyruvyl transferase family protein [Halieaceae bacterium]|nr:polysaccharide pyruvyl transferase family protein [Halieaceae bacterium]